MGAVIYWRYGGACDVWSDMIRQSMSGCSRVGSAMDVGRTSMGYFRGSFTGYRLRNMGKWRVNAAQATVEVIRDSGQVCLWFVGGFDVG